MGRGEGGPVFGGVKRRIMFLFVINYFSMHNKVIQLPSNLLAAVKSPLVCQWHNSVGLRIHQ